MKKIIITLFLIITAANSMAASNDLPEFTISDQFKRKYTSNDLAGEETIVLVYRIRDALETSKSHYDKLKELNSNFSVIRIADLSRVPGIFQGAAVKSLKRSDNDNSIYVDTKGDIIALFDVASGECGMLYYLNSQLVYQDNVVFTDAAQFETALLAFAASIIK